MNHLAAEVCDIIENGLSTNSDRELLAQSLFYYCCGTDPTPMIAFGSGYPLYIYSDIIDYGNGDFDRTTEELYGRLSQAGFVCTEEKRILHLKNIQNVAVTLWKTKSNEFFALVYIQQDAVKAFEKIYADGSHTYNFILPKCICNYRYEFIENSQENSDYFARIEKRTEYILGYCFSEKYKVVSEHTYYGDYEENTKVKLFRRMFWYAY